MILDTTFLIDLQREFRRREEGAARKFLASHADTHFRISVITVTEFLEGFDPVTEGERFIRNLPWISIDAEIARRAAEYRRILRLGGEPIGDFDLLIGATASVLECPLVTANIGHFQRLTGLELLSY